VASKKPRTPAPPRPVQAPRRRDTPPAARPRIGGGGGTPWAWIAGALAVLAIAGVVIGVFVFKGSSKPFYVDFSQVPNLQTGPPPWNNGVDHLQDRLKAAGVDPLAQEALAFHIHQHLDLYVNGKHVALPAGVGIYPGAFITQVHTHDTRGVIHVESPVNKTYTLGQLFAEWGVKLTGDCVGSNCGAGKVHWWVNGKQQTGDPARLGLKSHQEIAIAFGTPPTKIPSSYGFEPGE
jgi:hypothetical protein